MDDIVQRLRKWPFSPGAVPASDIMDEAADEIERLRRIVAMWEDCAFKTKDLYGNVFVPRTSTYDGGVNRIVSGEWSEPKVSTGHTGNQWFTIPEPPVPYEKNDENRGDSHAIRGTKEPRNGALSGDHPQPTLTDAEREAIEVAANWCETPIDPVCSQTSLAAQLAADALRGLLERTK